MKFLITGATGYIGRFIVEYFSKKYGKEKIDIYIRSLKKAKELKLHNLVNSIFTADLVSDDLSFLKSSLYDCIIMAHGKIMGHTYRSIYLNNRKAVRNILKNINRKSIKQIIYLSSVAAGGFKDDSVDKNYKSQPANAYGKAKLKTEEMLVCYRIINAIKITILRLPIVYGDRAGADFDHFIKGSKLGYIPYVSGNPYVSLCSVGNLIQALVCVVEKSADGIYQIADDKRYDIQEVIDIIRKAYGLKKVKIRGSFFKPLVNTLVKTALMFNNFSFPYLFLLQAMHNPFYCNIDKAKKELGFVPRDTFDKYFTENIAGNYFNN